MCGSATLTMVASSTTISCAVASTSRARPGRGPPAATPPGAAARVVLDRVSDMTGSPNVDLLPGWRGLIPAWLLTWRVPGWGVLRGAGPGRGGRTRGCRRRRGGGPGRPPACGRCGGRRREGARGEDAGGLQVLQAGGQDVAGDARQAGREVAVTARAEGQLPHEQQAPPFADDVQGSGDGARLPVVLHESHGTLCFYKCQLHRNSAPLG